MKNLKETILNSMKYYYIGSALLPIGTIISYIITNSFESSIIYSLIGIVNTLFIAIPGYIIAIYIKESIYSPLYILGSYLNVYRIGTFGLLGGLLLFKSNAIFGIVFFIIGYSFFSSITSITGVISTGLYLNMGNVSTNLRKDNLNYQLGKFISSLLMLLIYLLKLEELMKFYILFILFYIFLYFNYKELNNLNEITINTIKTIKYSFKKKWDLISNYIYKDIKELKTFPKTFKIYLYSTVLANLGSGGIFYFVYYIKLKLNISLNQILIITLVTNLINFIWSLILTHLQVEIKGTLFLMIGRLFYGISIILLLYSTSFLTVLQAYIVLRLGQLITSLGKKQIVSKLIVNEKSDTEVYALIRAIQSLFGIVTMLLMLLFGSYFKNAIEIVLVGSSVFYFISVGLVYKLHLQLEAISVGKV